jgi:hypothetical protein
MIAPAGPGELVYALGEVDAQGALNQWPLGYLLTPTIMNISDSNNGELTTERTVITEGARVQVFPGNGPDGMPILTQAELDALGAFNTAFTTLFSVNIPPDGGLAAASLDVLPPAVLAAIGQKLTAPTQLALVRVEVAVFGETVSGTAVESDAFSYPITVCNGCLSVLVGSCVGLMEDGSAGGACNRYQDEAIECCLESDMTTVRCPATPEEPPPPA